jgi:hypothetical protein
MTNQTDYRLAKVICDVLTESNCYMDQCGQSPPKRRCFEDSQIIPDRKNSGGAKTRCFEKWRIRAHFVLCGR